MFCWWVSFEVSLFAIQPTARTVKIDKSFVFKRRKLFDLQAYHVYLPVLECLYLPIIIIVHQHAYIDNVTSVCPHDPHRLITLLLSLSSSGYQLSMYQYAFISGFKSEPPLSVIVWYWGFKSTRPWSAFSAVFKTCGDQPWSALLGHISIVV